MIINKHNYYLQSLISFTFSYDQFRFENFIIIDSILTISLKKNIRFIQIVYIFSMLIIIKHSNIKKNKLA